MTRFWHGKRVLVTGGAGFIGSHVVDLLVANHAQVTATATRPDWPASLAHHGRDAVRVVRADLTNADECVASFRGQDVVLNIAHADGSAEFKRAASGVDFSAQSQHHHECAGRRVPLRGRTNSGHELGRGISQDGGRAASRIRRDILAVGLPRRRLCVVQAHVRVRCSAVRGRARVVGGYRKAKQCVRTPGLLRHGAKPRSPDDVWQAHEDGVLKIWGDGSQRRTFLYVEDLARGLLDLVERHAVCEPVNFAGDDEITIGEGLA